MVEKGWVGDGGVEELRVNHQLGGSILVTGIAIFANQAVNLSCYDKSKVLNNLCFACDFIHRHCTGGFAGRLSGLSETQQAICACKQAGG